MNGSSPLVSVIIPTYNREKHLPECLESVLMQTYTKLEAIVIDDGSTDATPTFMADQTRRDKRVRYIRKLNGGVSSARNQGIRSANGDLIAFLDSDDAWLPWKMETQVAAINELPTVGMIWSDMTAISESGQQIHDRFLRRMYGSYQKLTGPLFSKYLNLDLPPIDSQPARQVSIGYGNIYANMLYGSLVHTSTTLIRKERAMQTGLFDERYRRAGEDFGFHLRTCRFGEVALLDEPTTLYRIGADDQLTHRRNQVSLAQAFLETITDEVAAAGDAVPLSLKELNEILSEAHSWLGTELRAAGQTSQAVKSLTQALKCNYKNREAWSQLSRILTPKIIRQQLKRILHRSEVAHPSPV
ncbi:glycosyltransferase [Planctomicrobium sp. SH668]|uniref:glycosyltransferase family 2 protein n=1 Tax=Planctomicrobium sp. SH668 TaxID=3448126 RepID=UPI003F5BE51F